MSKYLSVVYCTCQCECTGGYRCVHCDMRHRYTHNCDKCEYLGTLQVGQFPMSDWYACGESILAREGNDGPNYWSCPISILRQLRDAGDPHAIQADIMLATKFAESYRHARERIPHA